MLWLRCSKTSAFYCPSLRSRFYSRSCSHCGESYESNILVPRVTSRSYTKWTWIRRLQLSLIDFELDKHLTGRNMLCNKDIIRGWDRVWQADWGVPSNQAFMKCTMNYEAAGKESQLRKGRDKETKVRVRCGRRRRENACKQCEHMKGNNMYK